MDKLVIRSEREFSLTFHTRKYGSDGWLESYLVEISARDFCACFIAENAREGSSPSLFFNDMAENPNGWTGSKGWGALEGEFDLSASMDSTGHVTLIVERHASWDAPSWSSTFSLIIEAGQLKALACDAEDFFADTRTMT